MTENGQVKRLELASTGIPEPMEPVARLPFWSEPPVLNVLLALLVGVVGGLSTASLAAGVVFGGAVWAVNHQLLRLTPHVQFLPLLQRLIPVITVISVALALGAATLVGLLPRVPEVLLLLGPGLSALLVSLPYWRARRLGSRRRVRLAVIGPSIVALDLRDELMALRRTDVLVLGHIAPGPGDDADDHGWQLGHLGGLADAIERHKIDLLLLSDEAPRMSVFDEVAETCSDTGVRVQELHAYYEQVFGHVPLGRINAAWFQWVMHPRYRVGFSPVKRAMDLAIAGAVSIVAMPLLGVLALLVRRDGGPAFFRQVRVGEHGSTFEIYKLRSMAVAAPEAATVWTVADDARVTGVGRFLRRTHLDELPQLLNVFRGEMSIVGPRPEQPGYVRQLELAVPHYSRRNIARPGITGWAQVKCGYAGSDEGSTWKLSHDLYYLKHGSFALDLLILGETLRTLVADRQFETEIRLPAFVRRREAERIVSMHEVPPTLEVAAAAESSAL